jgi:XTP/dITP diphosphohydrolase
MTEIVFATNNLHKIREIGALIDQRFRLLGLKDLGWTGDIPEDHDTLEENALQKAYFIHERYNRNCFADDTGLEVNALDGAPGVYSARYSRIGTPVFPDMEPAAGNIRKLLMALEGVEDRQARFRTVIALVWEGKEYFFEGIVNGEIILEPCGSEGFGYDPVFRPDGYGLTFAEMDLPLKNSISHRAKALEKLVEFLSGM